MPDKTSTGKEGRDNTADTPAVKKFGDGSIIAYFDLTPEPKKPDDIWCSHFWELKYCNGCKFDCAWCYLNGTYRFSQTPKAPRLKKMDKVVKIVEKALAELPPTIFNAGEVADALLYPRALKEQILPLFAAVMEKKRHKILLLTKDVSMDFISLPNHYKNFVVMAYSVNAPGVADVWEKDAPHPYYRLQTAREFLERGYEVRLRIDPIVPTEAWKNDYRNLVNKIMELTPRVSIITLGSLRGLQSTLLMARKLGNDMSWTQYLTDKSSWGKRVNTMKRIECYRHIIELLRRKGYKGEIALCKETLEVFEKMGLDYKTQVCNCMMSKPEEA